MELKRTELDQSLTRVLQTIASSTAPSTRRAYASAVAGWNHFCQTAGWATSPADGPTGQGEYLLHVLLYLQHQMDLGRSISTIVKIVAALKADAADHDPIAAEALRSSPELRRFVAGAARIRRGTLARRARAFTSADLRALHATLSGPALKDRRDRALIALGVATALRADSLAALTIGDVTDEADGSLTVRVRHSKTDQLATGMNIAVLHAADADIDPVAAVHEWRTALLTADPASALNETTPLFPPLRRNTVVARALRSPSEVITDLLRRAVVRAGIADDTGANEFSSHSLRATFVTLSLQAGVPGDRIAAVTGHRSPQMLRTYDRSTPRTAAQTAYLALAA